MFEALAILFMAAGVALAVWWAVNDQPRKAAGFAAAGLAVVAGATMLLRGQIVRLSHDEIETIEAAAAHAEEDADAIRELRASAEAEARAATGRVAAHAAEIRRLAAETSAAVAKLEKRVSALNEQAVQREAAHVRREQPAAEPAATGSPSTQQLEVVATALRSTGSHEVTLTTSMDDREAIRLAIRLKQAIESAGWIVHLNQTELEPISGVQVLAPVPLSPHVTALLGALGRAGLQPRGLARQEADKLEVVVGPKPRES
jgi:hypothetical protein